MEIKVQGISKRFGATLALDNIDLSFQSGEIHTLVGENGAGKSTLGKIISGVYLPDSGTISIDGNLVEFSQPYDALALGITIIAQELALVPGLSVLENIFLGIEDSRGPLINTKEIRRRFTELQKESGITLDADIPVASLRTGDQQKVEILRALARNAKAIVMDEPTARLSADEVKNLKDLIVQLKNQGCAIIFVSHFLNDVLEISDQISIMRDGKLVRTTTPNLESHESLVEAMTGRTFGTAFPDRTAPKNDEVVLKVENLSSNGVFENVSFEVRAGEIVGIAGLVGSGRTELVRAIVGADKFDSGEIYLKGKSMKNAHPAEGIKRKIAFLPESRKEQGIIPERSVRENVSLPHIGLFSRVGIIRKRREVSLVKDAITATGVKAGSDQVSIASLSGGNQQKALFARALAVTPELFIADEPTRGVDVGSKRAIYDLLAEQAAKGMGILVVSSELDEIVGLPHRVLVMQQGKIVEEIVGDQITEKNVLQAAFAK